MRAIQAIIAFIALAGCSDADKAYFGIQPGECTVEDYTHYEGVQEKKGLALRRYGVIVSGIATCLSGRISVRAYDSNGNLVGVDDGFINAGVFRIFVEAAGARRFDFRIKASSYE